MKRKWAACMLALFLLVQVVPPAADAASTVYFTAVDENVLELSDATMPFWSGGYLYVPGSIFSSDALGLWYSRNVAKKKVTIYNPSRAGKALIFDLAIGDVIDANGESYYPGALVRGGAVFVPVAAVASFFGLLYTCTKVNQGYLVWVRESNSSISVLSGAQFADAASYQMDARYAQYQKSSQPQLEISSQPEESGGVSVSARRISLCLAVKSPALCESLLDGLERYGAYATFYVTPEQAEQNPDLLRRMAASGQGIGLLADGADWDTVSDQLQRGNAALFRATNGKTRLVRLENAPEQIVAEAESAGYCCLTPDLNRAAYGGLTSVSAAQTLMKRISARRGAVSVWLGEETESVGWRAFLASARENGGRLLSVTETTAS